jgi:GTP:adenosylcobinamide-phosphate guanylyltransferase
MLLDAIITAGGDPEKDAALLAHAGGAPCKALIELGGKTFLEHITSAMRRSGRIRRIVIVGLAPEHRPDLGPEVTFLPDAGGMVQNGESGIEYLKSTGAISERIMASSSDIPLITPEIIGSLIDLSLAHDVDFCYTIVQREVMERAFPGSGRTFVPLADGRFAGGDIFVAKPGMLDSDVQKWRELTGTRKTFWKQVRIIGLSTLLLFAIRRLTIAEAERRASKALGLTAKAIIAPHAEAAMDVDKPHHLDAVRAAWSQRHQGVRDG